jgi:MFS family permease
MIKNILNRKDRSGKLAILIIVNFIFSFSQAVAAFIISSFLDEFIGLEMVGVVFAFAFAVSMFGLNYITLQLKKDGIVYTSLVMALLYLIGVIFMGIAQSTLMALLGVILFQSTRVLYKFTLSILTEEQSLDTVTGQIQGALLSITNFGWLLAMLFSGYVLENHGYWAVFLITGLIFLPAPFLVAYVFPPKKTTCTHCAYTLRLALAKFKESKSLSLNFILSFLTSLFYSIMVIYVPIYLHQFIGLNWEEIGVIFAVMIIPFLVLPYPLGKLSDKIFGEQEFLFVGFLITAISSFLIFTTESKDFIVWLFIILLTRIGAAIIESQNEIYFYKHVNGLDVDIMNFRMNFWPLAYTIGPIMGSITLLVAPIQYIFLVLTILLLLGTFLTTQLDDTQ